MPSINNIGSPVFAWTPPTGLDSVWLCAAGCLVAIDGVALLVCAGVAVLMGAVGRVKAWPGADGIMFCWFDEPVTYAETGDFVVVVVVDVVDVVKGCTEH